MIYRRKKSPQLKPITIQILNNLRTLHVARLCANFYQGTLTKGRKKLSLPPYPSLFGPLTWKHYGNRDFGSAYLSEAIWLLYMKRQQSYLLLNSNWSSLGACPPLPRQRSGSTGKGGGWLAGASAYRAAIGENTKRERNTRKHPLTIR